MRARSVAAVLLSLLLCPCLFAGESSPVVKLAIAPKYPTPTLEGRIEGQVIIRVTIDRAGTVKGAEIAEGHPMLREAAVVAARQWKFAESSVHKRVAMLRFNFVILPENSETGSETIFLPPTGIEVRQKPAIPIMEDQGGEFHFDPQPISCT